jgi:thymidylate synthase ThyX
MREVTPQAYLFMSSRLEGEADAFFRDIGIPDWLAEKRKETHSDGDIGIESAGRLCYRSWIPHDPYRPDASNPNVDRVREGNVPYVGNIIKQRHGSVFEHINVTFIFHNVSRVFCYVPGTEVFTEEGWKPIERLTTADRILTLDPATKLASFNYPSSVHSFDYNGKVGGWRTSQMVSPLVTPDHLLWVAAHDRRRARGLSIEENSAAYSEKMAFEEIFGKSIVVSHRVDMARRKDPEFTRIGDYSYDSHDLMSWLGWMATDGTFSKDRPNQCTINQSKDQNIPIVTELMDRLFGDRWRHHGPYGDSREQFFTVSDETLAEHARIMLGPDKENRDLNGEFWTYSPRLLRAFYEAVVSGDGNRHAKNGHEVIYCPSRHAAGQYQFLCSILGMSANVREDDRTGTAREYRGQVIRHNKPCYVVSVCRKSASLVRGDKQSWEQYSGKVYCPKTDHGLIYVRREGLPFWCGNTHELVRHRAGAGYSQESLRYVRLDALKAWVPGEARALGPQVVDFFIRGILTLEELQAEFIHLVGLDTEKDFKRKKILTSLARRLAPIGLATSIMATMNLRAWRFVIAQRSDPAAEEEMRLLIGGTVATKLKHMYPAAFQDMHQSETDEFSWSFDSPKI